MAPEKGRKKKEEAQNCADHDANEVLRRARVDRPDKLGRWTSSGEGRCLFQNQCGLLMLYNSGYKNSIGRHVAQAGTLFSSLVRTLHTLGLNSWRCSQTITITTTCVILSLTHSLTQAFTLKLNKLWQRDPFDVARMPPCWFACHFFLGFPNVERNKNTLSQRLYNRYSHKDKLKRDVSQTQSRIWGNTFKLFSHCRQVCPKFRRVPQI